MLLLAIMFRGMGYRLVNTNKIVNCYGLDLKTMFGEKDFLVYEGLRILLVMVVFRVRSTNHW